MSADNDNDAIPVELGKGRLFSLPLCDNRIALSVDGNFPVLEVTTLCGKVVEVPFHASAVQALQALATHALRALEGRAAEKLG